MQGSNHPSNSVCQDSAAVCVKAELRLECALVQTADLLIELFYSKEVDSFEDEHIIEQSNTHKVSISFYKVPFPFAPRYV